MGPLCCLKSAGWQRLPCPKMEIEIENHLLCGGFVASFVPRPMLSEETEEDQQNVIEELVDEKIDCNDDDDDEDDVLPAAESADPGASYSVHPSGRLTLVFKNSPQHGYSPAHSPCCVESRATETTVRDVRVKLERCDDEDFETPTKRSRLDDDRRTSDFPSSDPLQRLTVAGTRGEISPSEADTAVAGLLGFSSVSDDHVSRKMDESGPHFEQLHDGFSSQGFSSGGFLAAKVDLRQIDAGHLTTENGGGVVIGNPAICGATFDGEAGEVMSAVDSLMADLSQLNAETPDPDRRTPIPNGSVYFQSAASKSSLPSRTMAVPWSVNRAAAAVASLTDGVTEAVDPGVAVPGSVNHAAAAGSLTDGVTAAVDSILNVQPPRHVENMTHGNRLSFCGQAKFPAATSEVELDLDAAVKSILS